MQTPPAADNAEPERPSGALRALVIVLGLIETAVFVAFVWIMLNQSDAPVDVRVSLRAVDTPATGTAPAVRAGVTVDGDPVQTLRLPAGAQGTVYWPARVGEPAGEAGAVILRWTAVAGALNDAVELTIPVYAFATPEYVASSGAVRSETTEVVRGPATPGIQASDVTLNLWPSLVAALPETVRWVQEYPWRSNEWYASTLLTVLGLAKAGGSAPDATLVRSWVDWLQEGQESDGGWSWWPGDRYAPVSNPSLSAHVLLALTTARDADVAVNSDRLRRAAQYLRNQLDAQRDLHPNLRAAMVYALGTVDPAELTRAERAASERDSIGPLAKAFLVLAMRRTGVAADDQRLRPLLSDLISSAAISAAAANWDDDRAQGYWSNPTFTTAVAMQALARTDVEHPLVDNAIRWLMNERREGRWSSARDSAMAVLALGAVAEARGEAAAAFTYRVLLNNTPVSEGNVPRAGAAPATAITLRDAVQPGDNPLTISKNSAESGRLYYQLSYRTLRPGEEIGSLDRGLAVAHEILSAEDKPLRAAKTGDIVKVRVTVIAPSSMNYVQVEDFLPGGLEILDPSLRTTTGAVGDLLRGERERQAQLQRAACRVFYGACRAPWSHVDFRDDRVALFASSLPKGVHEYVYYARAAAPGKYVVRPSRVWETYFPDVFGRTDSGAFVVEP